MEGGEERAQEGGGWTFGGFLPPPVDWMECRAGQTRPGFEFLSLCVEGGRERGWRFLIRRQFPVFLRIILRADGRLTPVTRLAVDKE